MLFGLGFPPGTDLLWVSMFVPDDSIGCLAVCRETSKGSARWRALG